MESISRFFRPPPSSFFLFGPRGTGKSTWLRRQYPAARFFDLLDPVELRELSTRPESLEEHAHAEPEGQTIVIDEVQRVPSLLPVVHRLIEQKRGWRFVLTGSSSRKLKRTGADLLAGRAVLGAMHPFLAAELGDAFSLDEALTTGLLPMVVSAEDPRRVLQAYAGLYLKEEVQQEGLVRKLEDFARFLEAVSFSHGGVMSVSQVARECAVQRKTAESYVGVLEDLLLAFRVPVFTRRAKRAVAARPKLYLFDAGVYRSLRPTGPLDRPEELRGPALEGLVAQHLRAWLDYRQDDGRLFTWRTRAGVEVDFVVYGPDTFAAIEVKAAARVHSRDVASLRAFSADYPECEPRLLYRGDRRLVVRGIPCVPCDEFLRTLHPRRPLGG